MRLKALEHEAGKRKAEMLKTEAHTLEPGERSEFWEQRLAWRDSQDRRWQMSMSAADRAAALAYERNRDGKRVAA
jgi:hypothetical protein